MLTLDRNCEDICEQKVGIWFYSSKDFDRIEFNFTGDQRTKSLIDQRINKNSLKPFTKNSSF